MVLIALTAGSIHVIYKSTDKRIVKVHFDGVNAEIYLKQPLLSGKVH